MLEPSGVHVGAFHTDGNSDCIETGANMTAADEWPGSPSRVATNRIAPASSCREGRRDFI
jgi:hypothetical protein